MKLGGTLLAAVLVLSTGCLDKTQNEARKAANDGAKAFGLKQYDTAIERYKKATEKWRDHHRAWYGLGAAHREKKEFKEAADAFEKAVGLLPDDAMYQLLYGISLYEKTVASVKDTQAVKMGVKPEAIGDDQVDLTAANFEKTLQHLKEAAKLNPELWRAHYYIGKVYRDQGKMKEAADAITKSLNFAPPEPAPWIALSEIYKKWDYTDAALQVAEQALQAVQTDQSQLWYVAGHAYEQKGLYDKAIESYTKSLQAKPDEKNSKFQRGQAYFRKGDFVNAKRDLEEYSKSAGKTADFEKQQASRMLMDIAAKSATPTPTSPGGGAERMSPEDMVKKSKEDKAKKGG
jgi:tetratricopeptide (TPR) repeat protein